MSKDKTIDDLYKKTNTEKTSLDLDNLILTAAKQSCEPIKIRKSQPRKWYFAVSTAAVLVLGFSMILNVRNPNENMALTPIIEKPNTIKPEDSLKKQKPSGFDGYYQDTELESDGVFKTESSQAPIVSEKIIPNRQKLQSNLVKRKKQQILKIVAEKRKDIITRKSQQPKLESTTVVDQMKSDSVTASGFSEAHNNYAELIVPKEIKSDEGNNLVEFERVISSRDLMDEESLNRTLGSLADKKSNKSKNTKIFENDLKKLLMLIEKSKFKKAKRLLKKLKEIYPSNDFSEYQELLK